MSGAVDGILTRAAARFPDKGGIIVLDGATMTYAELDRRASAFAGVLHQQGWQLGDRLV